MKYYLLLLVCFLSIISQQTLAQNIEPNVKLVFETKNSIGKTATLHNFSILGTWQEVAKAEPDDNGILTFSVRIDKPERFLIIYGGFRSSNLFLYPNKDYHFYVDYENISQDITNENTDDLINMFFGKYFEFKKGVLYKGKSASELKGEDKIAYFVLEEESSKQFLQGFIDKYQPNAEEQYFLENFVRFSQLGYRFNAVMYGEQYDGFKEMVESPELLKLFSSVTFEPKFLEISPLDYSQPLSYYYRFRTLKSFFEDYEIKNWEHVTKEAHLGALDKISTYDIPDEFKEYLLAYVANEGIQSTEMYNYMLSILENAYPNSKYISLLNDLYLKEHQLNGKLAPEITGINSAGDSLSLSSLKGKVVYIDFWATWCKPCIAEFPNSIALKNKLEGRDDVVFLYVSVDSEKDKWANFLSKKPELKGIHINTGEEKSYGIDQAYGIRGIPHYVIVNKEGMIVENHAPRPSDKRTLEIILSLL